MLRAALYHLSDSHILYTYVRNRVLVLAKRMNRHKKLT